jgi:hypothetical protein
MTVPFEQSDRCGCLNGDRHCSNPTVIVLPLYPAGHSDPAESWERVPLCAFHRDELTMRGRRVRVGGAYTRPPTLMRRYEGAEREG